MVFDPSAETVEVTTPFDATLHWQRGAVAGFVAAVAMGAVIAVGNLAVLRDAIAGLYLLEGNLVAGALVHVVHGTLFGVLFALILSDPSLYRVEVHRWKTVVAGVVFALVLAVVGAGVIMPMWLDAVGAGASVPLPNVTLPLLAWHVVYGAVLGGVYAVMSRRWPASG